MAQGTVDGSRIRSVAVSCSFRRRFVDAVDALWSLATEGWGSY
jgi:hypothetical protein